MNISSDGASLSLVLSLRQGNRNENSLLGLCGGPTVIAHANPRSAPGTEYGLHACRSFCRVPKPSSTSSLHILSVLLLMSSVSPVLCSLRGAHSPTRRLYFLFSTISFVPSCIFFVEAPLVSGMSITSLVLFFQPGHANHPNCADHGYICWI